MTTVELKYPCDCENGDAHINIFASMAICHHCECVFVAASHGKRKVTHVYAVGKWLESLGQKAS